MNVAPALEHICVGIVVERRKAASAGARAWIDHVWQPVAVLPGLPQAEPWTVLGADSEAVTYYAGAADIALYRTETERYRDNLASGAPSLWVVLRSTGAEPPFAIVSVTADPAEGESFTQAGDDLVAAVPMPPAVRETLEAFVAEHHVDQPFFKRQRDRADPSAHGRPQHLGKDKGR